MDVFLLTSLVDKEETALLHEEATMTIEELLIRYGQDLSAAKHAKKLASEGAKGSEGTEKGINGEVESTATEADSNGKAKAAAGAATAGGSKIRACRRAAVAAGDSGSSGSGSGSGSSADKSGKEDSGVSSTGDAGPSCSASAAQGSTKSKFFDDSESEDGEEEEEGSDEEVMMYSCDSCWATQCILGKNACE